MTTDQSQVFAIVLAAAWAGAGVLAFTRRRAAAVAGNVLIAAPIWLFSAWPILRVAFDREAYIRQYGTASLAEIPLTWVFFVLSLIAVIASLVSLRRARWLLVGGWLANAPTVAFLVYMAFWFRIF